MGGSIKITGETMIAVENTTLLTVSETARELNVSKTTVYEAMSEGRLTYVYKYGRKLINKTHVDEYKRRTQPLGHKRIGRPPRLKK